MGKLVTIADPGNTFAVTAYVLPESRVPHDRPAVLQPTRIRLYYVVSKSSFTFPTQAQASCLVN